ncbi:DUF6174 domain-containing protein [Streptomyces sp. NPDC051940]|uniref:DUF6174 domain-containing protein n=1 Tax=Streptomyces sp. NPDC051940 TaxID=3155675 RepID=UPI0034256FC5
MRRPGPAARSLAGRAAAALTAGAALLGLAGCAEPEATATAGRPAWEEPADYSFTIDSRCGERGFLGLFRIRVAGREVSGVEPLDEGARAAPRSAALTLGQVLAEYQRAREAGADLAEAEFDEADGHPVRIEVDPDERSVDDEFCYRVSAYAVG